MKVDIQSAHPAELARSRPRQMRLSFDFDRADVSLEYSLIGVVVHLAGCPTTGEPGSPALPSHTVRLALPPKTRPLSIEVKTSQAIHLADQPLEIAPLQPTRPGLIPMPDPELSLTYKRPDEADNEGQHRSVRLDPRQAQPAPDRRFAQPFPTPPFVPARPELYREATQRQPAELIQTATTTEGLTPVATLKLNPVRLTPDGRLEFTPQLEVIIHYEYEEDSDEKRQPAFDKPANIVSRAQAMRQIALTRRSVLNPDWVLDYSDIYPLFPIKADYLIITDNQRWNAASIAPAGGVSGDMVGSFERLAQWKRGRGLSAKVVTITDIVGGRYGDFLTGSRDLQEVIRNFLKMAHADWGVAWVLLGGDIQIVPVRRVAGGNEGYVNRQATNPPPKNTSFWTGTYLKMNVVDPGVWWGAATTNLLVRPDTGLLIPYDAAGTSNSTTRGWYFTTDDTYSTRSADLTNFVRVNGPAGEVNADLQFLYEWNTIPTDMYYSSLVGTEYNKPGKHDWDLLDNGIYGQNNASSNLDGINYTPSVSLGRAPVSSVTQADTFVNKVIAYEKYQRPDGTALPKDWIRKVVLVSDNWGGRIGLGETADNPPGDNQYHHEPSATHSLIKLKDTPDWNWSLLAQVSDTDVRVMPYRTDAASVGRGWYFATSETNLNPNAQSIPLPFGGQIVLPLPSQWIVVYGTMQELIPANGYVLNNKGLDGSLADQEALRQQMAAEMPGFDKRQRLYQDIEDMSPAQIAAGPVQLLTADRLRDALNAGPHILSLSGHGNSWGCCQLGQSLADSLTNGYQTFIAYADSCLTNQFDGDAMSEHLLNNPNGGAVAYIGSTRFSWIGVGDDIQRRFFEEWGTLGGNAHLGLLFDTRAGLVNNFYWGSGRWTVLTLNLMGDPEMPLWWHEPLKLRTPEKYLIDKILLRIDPNPPDPPYGMRIEQPYVRNWGLTYVHLRQGTFQQLFVADAMGRVEGSLAGFQSGAATLTIARAGHQPLVETVELGKKPESEREPGGGKGKRLWRWLLGGIAFVILVNLLRRLRR